MPAGSGQPPEVPRALCLTPEDRGVIVGRLARAVLRFQDEFLSRESSPAGLLCQARLRRLSALRWSGTDAPGPLRAPQAAPQVSASARWVFPSPPGAPAPLPAQVWLPDVVEDNQIVLKTKVRARGGLPPPLTSRHT